MFRLPLSFGRVPTPLAPVAPLVAGLGLLPACCPTHEARTGTAAAAAAPLRSVRLLMPSVVRSLVTSTSRYVLSRIYTCWRREAEQRFRASQAIWARRAPAALAAVDPEKRDGTLDGDLSELPARGRIEHPDRPVRRQR